MRKGAEARRSSVPASVLRSDVGQGQLGVLVRGSLVHRKIFALQSLVGLLAQSAPSSQLFFLPSGGEAQAPSASCEFRQLVVALPNTLATAGLVSRCVVGDGGGRNRVRSQGPCGIRDCVCVSSGVWSFAIPSTVESGGLY